MRKMAGGHTTKVAYRARFCRDDLATWRASWRQSLHETGLQWDKRYSVALEYRIDELTPHQLQNFQSSLSWEAPVIQNACSMGTGALKVVDTGQEGDRA